MARALQAAVGVLLVAALAVAGGYAYFALTFGSADHAEFTLHAEQFTAAELAENVTAVSDPAAASVIDRAYHNGSAVTLDRFEPDVDHVARNGTYYRVRVAEADVTVERPVLTIERVNRTDGAVRRSYLLPAADEAVFDRAWRAWMVHNTDRGSGDPPVRGVYETVPDDDDSVLLPEQEVRYVNRSGRTFRLRVERRNVSLDGGRVTLEPVAENRSAFLDRIVRNAGARLSGEDTAALERAVENGTYVSRASTFDRAWGPLEPVADLCGVPPGAVDGYDDRTCYVRYEGTYYRLDFGGYDTFA